MLYPHPSLYLALPNSLANQMTPRKIMNKLKVWNCYLLVEAA